MGKDSTQTTKTELPPPTKEELEAMAQQSALVELYFDQAGYSINKTEKTVYQNPAVVEQSTKKINDYQTRMNQIDNEIMNTRDAQQKNALVAEKNRLTNWISQEQAKIDTETKNATTDFEYTFEKKPDPRVVELESQGKRAEAEALKAELKQQELDQVAQKDRINAAYLDAAEKLISGDFSITAEQEAQAKQYADLYKEPIMKAINTLRDEIGITADQTFASLQKEQAQILSTKSSVSSALDNLESKINQTGLDVETALLEADNRARENNVDMNTALDLSIEASRKLMENNLFETMKDVRIKNARLAAATGRASTDSNLVERLNQQAIDAVKNAELNLASMAAQGKLQVSEKTADALMGIADYRVRLRATQGEKREGVATTRAQLEQQAGEQLLGVRQRETQATTDKGLKLEDVARMRAGVEEAGSKIASGLRLNAAQPVTMLQAGGGAINTLNTLDTGITQSWLDRANQNINQTIVNEQSLRKSQPTTTVTSTPSLFEGILSTIGTLGSGAGSIMGGIGSLRNAGKQANQ